MPLGEEVPANVIVWAKKATKSDVRNRHLGQSLEIVTRLEHVLDFLLFASKGIDFSVSYIPGVNKIVEELDYWKNASHITEDTDSVFAWIYAPNSYGKTKRITQEIRFNDFIGIG